LGGGGGHCAGVTLSDEPGTGVMDLGAGMVPPLSSFQVA